jgi:glutamate dehydrogenase (NADP+)
MPCTLDAVHQLLAARKLFGPAKAANAGGVAVSGLEQAQNSMRIAWSHEEVESRLAGIMKNIHTQCVQHGKQADGFVNYVNGANIAGFVKVADAMQAFGVM